MLIQCQNFGFFLYTCNCDDGEKIAKGGMEEREIGKALRKSEKLCRATQSETDFQTYSKSEAKGKFCLLLEENAICFLLFSKLQLLPLCLAVLVQ